jgi:hypothetical protein
MHQKKDGEKKRFAATMMQRFDHNWATPTGVEIVVVRPEHDHPDQIARFGVTRLAGAKPTLRLLHTIFSPVFA